MLHRIKEFNDKHPTMISFTYWPIYLLVFSKINTLVIPKYTISCWLDQYIPFNEYYLIPYASWALLIFGTLIYFVRHSKEDYLHLCFMMYTSMIISIILYIVFPSQINIRVDIQPNNFFSYWVKYMQSVDNPTNVCPSIHVCTTIIMNMVVLQYDKFKHPGIVKSVNIIQTLLIVISTMALKQHSIIDVIAGILLAIAMHELTYKTKIHERLTD